MSHRVIVSENGPSCPRCSRPMQVVSTTAFAQGSCARPTTIAAGSIARIKIAKPTR
jgi:hypothetical protein